MARSTFGELPEPLMQHHQIAGPAKFFQLFQRTRIHS